MKNISPKNILGGDLHLQINGLRHGCSDGEFPKLPRRALLWNTDGNVRLYYIVS